MILPVGRAYEEAWQQTLDTVQRVTAMRLGSRPELVLEGAVMALFVEAWWRAGGKSDSLSFSHNPVSDGSSLRWELRLGAFTIGRTDVEAILQRFEDKVTDLRVEQPWAAEIAAMEAARVAAEGVLAALRDAVPAHERLQRVMEQGQCDLCPL